MSLQGARQVAGRVSRRIYGRGAFGGMPNVFLPLESASVTICYNYRCFTTGGLAPTQSPDSLLGVPYKALNLRISPRPGLSHELK